MTRFDFAGKRETADLEQEQAKNCPFAQRGTGKGLGNNNSWTVLERCNQDLLPGSEEGMRTTTGRECVRETNLGKVLADLTASQTAILAFRGSLPGGMANTRHIESGVTEGDNL